MSRWLDPDRLTTAVAPMGIWALHFVVAYSLVGLGCAEGWNRRQFAGTNWLSGWLVLLTFAALAGIAVMGWRAWRRWRRLSDADDALGPLQRRRSFLALAATILAVLAAIAVVFTATPVFMLPPCA